jgi:chitinase
LRTVPDTSREVSDDATRSPYPIWNTEKAYPLDRKVVWRGQVYVSKWWNQNHMPDAPVDTEDDTPWRLVGPVLLNERPIPTTTLAPGTFPRWSNTIAYDKGTRGLLNGYGYEAKWWTRGEPDKDVPNEWETPWKPLA